MCTTADTAGESGGPAEAEVDAHASLIRLWLLMMVPFDGHRGHHPQGLLRIVKDGGIPQNPAHLLQCTMEDITCGCLLHVANPGHKQHKATNNAH